MRSARLTDAASGQGEALAAWALWAVVTLAVVTTYARLEPAELYNVSRSGLEGGLSRALVLVNFPIAFVAMGTTLAALGSLARRWWLVGGPAIVLCAVVAWPGVVDEGDLDARVVNAVPALGVALALGLTVAATARTGPSLRSGLAGDRVRLAVAAAAVLIALPWVAADVGAYLPGGVFLTDELVTRGNETLAAVHLGHHHGFDGALLVLTGLLLSRARPRGAPLRVALTGYASLMLAYGAVNAAQDAWLEQIVKRGWVGWEIPSALRPDLAPVWLAVLALAGACAWALTIERERESRPL